MIDAHFPPVGSPTASDEVFCPHASYLTINISSPDTPGLRGLQERSQLEELIGRVRGALDHVADNTEHKPSLLLKIAPDLIDEELDDIAAVAMGGEIDGVIVSNTTIARPALKARHRGESGGLSGVPLFSPSTKVLAHFYLATNGSVPLVGVGGINSVDTAWEKICAGASLIQIYTGLVFEGPELAARIKRGLVKRLRLEKHRSITDIIGSKAKEWAPT